MDYILRVEYDDSPTCPMEWDGQWKLVSFNRNSIHYENPEDYLRWTNDGTKVVPANIGLANKMRVGLAFVLQYYEHGLGRYDIQGSGPQCQWDTSNFGGMLIWENKPGDMGAKTYADREKDAEAFLEEYNNWMNGHVFGYMIDPADHEEGTDDALDESCWGFYDPDYMSKEVAALFKPGDRVKIEGQCADVFEESELKAKGVTVVDDYDDEEDDEEAA